MLIQHKNLTLELNKSKSELLRSKLRIFQESTGLNIKDFCTKIDFRQNTFSKIINGHKVIIDAILIGKIILQYDVNPRWFFSDQEKMYLHQEESITIKNQANIMNLVQVVEEIAKEMSVLRATVSSLQQDLKS